MRGAALALLIACAHPSPAPPPPQSPQDLGAEVAAGLAAWHRACPHEDDDGLCTGPPDDAPRCAGPVAPAPSIVPRDPTLLAEARAHFQAALALLPDSPHAIEVVAPAKLALADASLEALFARASFTHADDQQVIDQYSELYMELPWAHSSLYGAGYERQALLYEWEGRRAANQSTVGVNAEALQLGFCDEMRLDAESTLDGARRFYAACVDHGDPSWAATCRRKWNALAPWAPRTPADMEAAVRLYESLVAVMTADAADCERMAADIAQLATANQAELTAIARFPEQSPDARRAMAKTYGQRLIAIATGMSTTEKACLSSQDWQAVTAVWWDAFPSLTK